MAAMKQEKEIEKQKILEERARLDAELGTRTACVDIPDRTYPAQNAIMQSPD
jgi:hypothetical protein